MLIKKINFVLSIFTISILAMFSSINIIGEGFNTIEENIVLTEEIFNNQEVFDYSNAKIINVKSVNSTFEKNELGRKEMYNNLDRIKQSKIYDIFKLQNDEIDNNKGLSTKQKKSL